MATTTSITTTYAGEFKNQIIAAALLSAPTIDAGGITVKPGIKYKEVMKKLSTDAILKDATCDFDATSTITLTERILQPEEFQVNLQICKSDFHSDWLSSQQGFSAFDVVPKSFQDFLVAHVAAKVAAKNETNIWSGATANAGEFNGFATLLAADAALPAAQEVAGTTVTSSNVVAEMGKIVDAIPAALYGNDGLHIYVSQNIARAYVRALGGFAASGLGANGTNALGTQWYNNGSLSFDGVKIFVANGMGTNRAIATTKDNLFFGTGLLADMDASSVQVIDMSPIDGSQNARVIMRMTAGVQYGSVEDIVTYGITNSAN
jgi:hypothetical protein